MKASDVLPMAMFLILLLFLALSHFNMEAHCEDSVMVRANSAMFSLLPSNNSQAVALDCWRGNWTLVELAKLKTLQLRH